MKASDERKESSFDCDFRNVNDHGKSFVRGGQPYIRPTGCYRYALNIRGKYDGSDWWLGGGKNGGGWLMAYHGTSIENIREIVRTGFHMSKAKRTAFGRGIYCAPDPTTAKQYATQFVENGRRYRAILQCRVDPRKYRVAKVADRSDGEYWAAFHPGAIRPFAICVYAE
ncbi:hypothetical protein AAVH_10868 [Aphelenchoides avenae]|nr:hypothetical protein AAVH_10868 [Aphelenchus avenae]